MKCSKLTTRVLQSEVLAVDTEISNCRLDLLRSQWEDHPDVVQLQEMEPKSKPMRYKRKTWGGEASVLEKNRPATTRMIIKIGPKERVGRKEVNQSEVDKEPADQA